MSSTSDSSIVSRIFDRVLPTAPDFFGMLSEQSRHVVHTVELLVEFMQTDSKEVEAQIHADEHAADDVKVANIHILNEAFSTPIDREDIYRAITNLDDIVNYCKDTVNEMAALGVSPDHFTVEMSLLLLTRLAPCSWRFAPTLRLRSPRSTATTLRLARRTRANCM